MLAGGWPRTRITRLWLAVCGLSVLAAAAGYLFGVLVAGSTGALSDSFAAGSLLVMLTDSMIPEAFQHGGREAGLALVRGFGAAVVIAVLQAP
jgi:ZIP family zinc transporter